MTRIALLLALVACDAAEPPVRPPETPVRAPAAAPIPDQAQLAARWRGLSPLGFTYASVVERIPKAERAAMAYALVREGNTTCPRIVDECGNQEVDGPNDAEGIDAPCLRRRLVEYLFANEGRLAIPADVLTAIARSGDAEMVNTVARNLDDKPLVDFLVEVEAAGTTSPYGVLISRPHATIVDAALRHVDAAIPELSQFDAADRDLVIAAIADTAIAPSTRAGLLIAFDAPHSTALVTALEAAAAESDCGLSANARELLAKLGDPSRLPRNPRTGAKAFFHALCVFSAGGFWDHSEMLAATFVPKSGLVVVMPTGEDFSEDTKPMRRTVTYEDELIPTLNRLAQATCDAKRCTTESGSYDLAWSRGQLVRITLRRDLARERAAQEAAAACDPGLIESTDSD